MKLIIIIERLTDFSKILFSYKGHTHQNSSSSPMRGKNQCSTFFNIFSEAS
jgi:hypothetical protein